MESWKNELYHHGILGMKWGVRRYQNKDGTLTAAGKKKYGSSPEKVSRDVMLKQIDKTLFRDSKSQEYNRKVREEAYKKVDETEEGKTLAGLNNQIKSMQELARLLGIPGSSVVVNQEFKNTYDKAVQNYMSKVNDFINTPEVRDHMSSLLLSEIGYEDTKAGREYVSDILNQTFEETRQDRK